MGGLGGSGEEKEDDGGVLRMGSGRSVSPDVLLHGMAFGVSLKSLCEGPKSVSGCAKTLRLLRGQQHIGIY